jgi:hypothetical protein
VLVVSGTDGPEPAAELLVPFVKAMVPVVDVVAAGSRSTRRTACCDLTRTRAGRGPADDGAEDARGQDARGASADEV